MDLTKLIEENRTLRKKIKNLKRTKLRLKHNLNSKIAKLEDELNTSELNKDWQSITENPKI
tara:strand:+ start:416 stop:598 length:183 start_codon:yes stop_codon:yes gene_type:complete